MTEKLHTSDHPALLTCAHTILWPTLPPRGYDTSLQKMDAHTAVHRTSIYAPTLCMSDITNPPLDWSRFFHVICYLYVLDTSAMSFLLHCRGKNNGIMGHIHHVLCRKSLTVDAGQRKTCHHATAFEWNCEKKCFSCKTTATVTISSKKRELNEAERRRITFCGL